MTLRVTVEDVEAGTSETTEVTDYLLIVAAPCHLSRRKAGTDDTHVLTVKRAHRAWCSIDETFEVPDGSA